MQRLILISTLENLTLPTVAAIKLPQTTTRRCSMNGNQQLAFPHIPPVSLDSKATDIDGNTSAVSCQREKSLYNRYHTEEISP